MKDRLISNLDLIHTTPMGEDRIRRNLSLKENVICWCKAQIVSHETVVYEKGKNLYVVGGNFILTIHAKSYTIITAHKK